MDPEAVNQIVKAITFLHDGRMWKSETIVAAGAALVAAGAAGVTYRLGKRQITSAREVAQQQITAAKETAQKQIKASQDAAQGQIESAQAVAKLQIDAAQAAAQSQIESAQAVAAKQNEVAQTVAHWQLVMPMREAWIGKLREKLGALIGAYVDGHLGRYPFLPADVQRLTAMQTEIGLMLNLDDPDQAALDAAIQSLFNSFTTKSNDGVFREAVRRAAACSRIVLRSEWQRAQATTAPSRPTTPP